MGESKKSEIRVHKKLFKARRCMTVWGYWRRGGAGVFIDNQRMRGREKPLSYLEIISLSLPLSLFSRPETVSRRSRCKPGTTGRN
jgi:hypothetical protein